MAQADTFQHIANSGVKILARLAARRAVQAQLKEAERIRAFAWRRLSALGDMARIAALEPDRDLAVERQLVALFRYIGWIENGLTHKPNFIRAISIEMAFVLALAVRTPSNAVNMLRWLRWGWNVSGT